MNYIGAPNPGSYEARTLGCRCPVDDNAYGLGALGGAKDATTGETIFYTSSDCKIHWVANKP